MYGDLKTKYDRLDKEPIVFYIALAIVMFIIMGIFNKIIL